MTCMGYSINFCHDCGVKTPHPTGSTCVHARAGVHERPNCLSKSGKACGLIAGEYIFMNIADNYFCYVHIYSCIKY